MAKKIAPVLFLIFNRLDATKQVFQAIRQAKPQQLFIAADGARHEKMGEVEKCEAVRKYVLDNIDWDCEVKTLFQEKNLGCGKAVSNAITWFFNQVEEGIILEDDCLPHPDFFEFCTELLDKYKYNEQIAIISGDNFRKIEGNSYYFTNYPHIWGWATWRRFWNMYQFDLNLLDKNLIFKQIDILFRRKEERNYWKSLFNKMLEHKIDTWDYQLAFQMWYRRMCSIAPNVNLIQNIGFGKDATHTTDSNSRFGNQKIEPIIQLTHPQRINIERKKEEVHFNDVFYRKTGSKTLRKHLTIKHLIARCFR